MKFKSDQDFVDLWSVGVGSKVKKIWDVWTPCVPIGVLLGASVWYCLLEEAGGFIIALTCFLQKKKKKTLKIKKFTFLFNYMLAPIKINKKF